MSLKLKKPLKSMLSGRNNRNRCSHIDSLNKNVGLPVGISDKSIRHVGINGNENGIYTMTREDVEREIANGEKEFGMPITEFYKSWQDNKLHGFHAMKLVCLYDFYRKEYE
ncbi:MAG: hypothetical protein WC556_06435 [Candidatus Methanoperedens sp.]